MLRKIYKDQIEVLTLDEAGVDRWPNLSWSDAPAALIINDNPNRDAAYNAVWGLEEKVGVEIAWSDFDYSDEYQILD